VVARIRRTDVVGPDGQLAISPVILMYPGPTSSSMMRTEIDVVTCHKPWCRLLAWDRRSVGVVK